MGIWERYWLDQLARGADPALHDAARDAFIAGAAATLTPWRDRVLAEIGAYDRIAAATELAASVGLRPVARRCLPG